MSQSRHNPGLTKPLASRGAPSALMRRRHRSKLTLMTALLLAVLVGGLLRPPLSHGLIGSHGPVVSVVDGDTLQVGDRVVDLFGIDAPELGQHCLHDDGWQSCGLAAAFELRKLLALEKGKLTCTPVSRAPAVQPGLAHRELCRIGDVDLANVLLEAGYAMATDDADQSYHDSEKSAQRARLGLWHSSFANPADWRAGNRLPGEPDPELNGCPVKGIHAADGSRRYLVPTDEGYDAVRLDPARGDRAFCSDEAARADGWRRPGEAQ
jgi:endonuclease YncB( thermonuclease family)